MNMDEQKTSSPPECRRGHRVVHVEAEGAVVMTNLIRVVVVGFALTLASGGGTPAVAGTIDAKPQAAAGSDCTPASTAVCPCPAPGADASFARFGVELLDAVSGAGGTSALVSPFGVGTVLTMLAQGATDPVRRSIGEMLEGGNVGPAGMLPCRLARVVGAAEKDAGVELRIANAAFADRRLDLFPSFSAVLGDRFGAHVERIDFARENAVERINAWVAKATDEAIPRLVSHLDSDDVLVLANAMHFHGEWSQPFDPTRTAPLPFHPRPGEVIEVATMQADDLEARYREDGDYRAIALPYGGGDFVLVVVLPREGLEPSAALRGLATDPSWLGGSGYRRMHGSLALPRVTLHGEASLLPTLSAFGLASALDDADAFAGIAAPPPVLSRVMHRTMLVLDEHGTKAAAATAAVMRTRAAIVLDDGFDMRVDRPFVLAVRHRGSGALLFAAWVADPSGG